MRRSMLKMSQSDLADGLGLPFQQVQKYEKGTNRIGATGCNTYPKSFKCRFHFSSTERRASRERRRRLRDSDSYVNDFLATSDGLALAKAFMRIPDPKLRPRYCPPR
jgi:transcriptional regulator with XRE-family HTH domain